MVLYLLIRSYLLPYNNLPSFRKAGASVERPARPTEGLCLQGQGNCTVEQRGSSRPTAESLQWELMQFRWGLFAHCSSSSFLDLAHGCLSQDVRPRPIVVGGKGRLQLARHGGVDVEARQFERRHRRFRGRQAWLCATRQDERNQERPQSHMEWGVQYSGTTSPVVWMFPFYLKRQQVGQHVSFFILQKSRLLPLPAS